MTRSAVLTTDDAAGPPPRAVYTAFGDPVTYDAQAGWQVGFPVSGGGMGVLPVSRCQYDGGWGYESGLITLYGEDTTLPPVTLQHVGERWYQPGLGRFVQRDPIGLAGGMNVYAYGANRPVSLTDASGRIVRAAGAVIVLAVIIVVEVYVHHVGEEAAKDAIPAIVKRAVRADIVNNNTKLDTATCIDLGPDYPYAKYKRLGNGKVVVVIVNRDGEKTVIFLDE